MPLPTEDRLDRLSRQWREAGIDMDISPWQIWGRITRLQEIFLASIQPALSSRHLNFKEFQTLAALVLSGPPYETNPNALGKFNLLTSGGLTNLLTRMERDAYITRRPDPNDGRGVIVQLTEKGRAAFDAAVRQENEIEHKLLGTLSPEERLVLATLLRKLLQAIDPEPLP